jgi:hypothetical protein
VFGAGLHRLSGRQGETLSLNPGLRLLAVCLLHLCLLATTRADVVSTTQPVAVALTTTAKLSVPSDVRLTAEIAPFQPFRGTVPVLFRVRSSSGGGGNITLQVTADFAPAGGPSAAAGALTYQCGTATLGVPCAGVQTAVPGAQTPVLAIPPSACTGGGGACSPTDPNVVQVHFLLDNNPAFSTGGYSARITFVISSL